MSRSLAFSRSLTFKETRGVKVQGLVLVVVVPLLLALAACTDIDGNTTTSLECPDGLEPATEYRLYFGLTDSEGQVISQDYWQAFVDGAVTPRFPDGLTILDAYGQFQPTGGDLIKESSRVLVIGVPDSFEGDAWRLLRRGHRRVETAARRSGLQPGAGELRGHPVARRCLLGDACGEFTL